MFGRKSTVHQGEYDLQERKAWEVLEGEGISKKLIFAILLITLLIIVALVFAILLFIALRNQPEATSEDLLPSPRAFTDTPEPPPSDPDNDKTFVGSFVDKESIWTEKFRNPNDPETKTKMREYEEMMFDSFYTTFAHNSIPQVKMLSPVPNKMAALMQNRAVEPFVKVRFEISMAPTVEISEAQLGEWLLHGMSFSDILIELGGRNQIADLFSASIDTAAAPCDDFFAYACGKWDKPDMSFDAIQNEGLITVAHEFNRTESKARIVAQAKIAFDTCMEYTNETDYASMLLTDIKTIFGNWPAEELDTTRVFQEMGQLAGIYRVNTLLSVSVGVDWARNPLSPYAVYVDQATLTLPAIDYLVKDLSKNYSASLHKAMYKTFQYFVKYSKAPISPESINDTVNEMIKLETVLAKIMTPSQDRRNYKALYHRMRFEDAEAEFGSIGFRNFLAEAVKEYHMTPELLDDRLIFEDVSYFGKLNTFLNGQKKATLVNYLVWRYIHSYGLFVHDAVLKGIFEELKAEISEDNELTDDWERVCVGQIMIYLPFVAGRLYIDAHWKNLDPTARDKVRTMITQVLGAFGEELDSLTWMTHKTKWLARLKIKNLIDNVAYPDWMLDDTELDASIPDQHLSIPSDNFYNVLKTLRRYDGYRLFNLIHKTEVDRSDFQMSPAWVNAWYEPPLNSITFPAAILNSPFFRTDFPMAVNLGGLGVVIGHELTHGFDDQGVQFGPTGIMNNWMDKRSAAGFKKMADCVVKQYDNFQDPTVHLNISGKNTQGENIADNGGIRASYRAYQTWVKEMGPEHHLPAPMNKYSMDQIFFLSFAQVWCSHMKPEALRKKILTNVHSPPEYRVIGTLQNFEKFGEAFGCQVDSYMAPKDHCHVW